MPPVAWTAAYVILIALAIIVILLTLQCLIVLFTRGRVRWVAEAILAVLGLALALLFQ